MTVFSNWPDLARLSFSAVTAVTMTVTSWVSIAALDVCGSAALASRNFGRDAQDGRDGRAGRAGRDGISQTIRATGESLRLDLSGTDGEDGDYGEDGDWLRCRRQPHGEHQDLQAADGGDGGNGGNGGRGGNGGDLIVHYTNPSELRQILVVAEGGRGGRGGRGGDGTDGCDCDDNHWTVKICQEDGTCSLKEYECYDGRDGNDGNDGRDGNEGTMGQLVLINQVEPLPQESPSKSAAIARLANQPITLSRNLWETRSGARTLLAPGSIIANEYKAYTGHIERQFILDWQAPQTAQTFTDAVDLKLQADGQVSIDFPKDYWLLGETIEQETLTTYRVDGLVPVSEATQLAVGRVDGRSRTFEVNVVDLAQQSDVLDTRFEVRYSTSNSDSRRRRYDLEYAGPVPEDLITQDHNRFTLSLGRLPIQSQLLSGGTQAQVELTIIRSYGNNSAEQTLTWSGEI